MKKHLLTPAEQARRDERKAKFAALVKRVAEMSDVERAEIAAKINVVTADGNALSPRNTMLVYFQLGASVTIVGGFRQWLKQGRCVRKGEHGASILVPCTPRKDENKQEGEESTKDSRVFFTSGTVFDVSQTQAIEESGKEAA